MSHAWLFTGPAGSGRSVAARALAAALQCVARRPPGLRRLLGLPHGAGRHPPRRAARSCPRGCRSRWPTSAAWSATAARLPALGRWQVVVIEDADRMTEGASNALLKAIEEPPARTIFLLCAPSTHPDDVSVTMRSRCRLVSLRTPPADAVAAVLVARRRRRRDGRSGPRSASQGHVGRARRLARDERGPVAAQRGAGDPGVAAHRCGACVAAADQLVRAAEAEASSITAELDADETQALQTALGRRARPARARRPRCAARPAWSRISRSGSGRGPPAPSAMPSTGRWSIWPRSTATSCSCRPARPGPFAHPDFDDEVRAVALGAAAGRRAAVPRRGAGLPAGARAERQADHRRAGDDRGAAAAGCLSCAVQLAAD